MLMRDRTSPLISFIETFLAAKTLAPKSQKDYRRYLTEFDRFTGCGSLVDALTLEHAAQYLVEVRIRGPYAAHNACMYLKSFASWITKNGYLSGPSPIGRDILEAPKTPQARREPFTDEEMQLIWSALELMPHTYRQRSKALLKLLFGTGMRRNEARQLAIADLHIAPRGGNSWVLIRAATSKGQKERRVILDESLVGDIDLYVKDDRIEYTGPRNRPEPLFTTRQGRMFSEWGWSSWCDRIWDSIERETKIHGFSHRMRHTWATNYHRASKYTGKTVYDLKAEGGWADLNIPLRYTHERPFEELLAMPTHISELRKLRKVESA